MAIAPAGQPVRGYQVRKPGIVRAMWGPGWLIAVGYMDPGNWATDLAAGSHFGYSLLFVVAGASAAGLVLQLLAARLGLAGLDLAEACRRKYHPVANIALWLLCEAAIIACDVAEIVGTAMALNLLFGMPLLLGVLGSVGVTFAALMLERRGIGTLQAGIGGLVIVVVLCFGVQMFLANPDGWNVLAGFVPSSVISDKIALYLAVGIIGATVMPHNLYLHSGLVKRAAGGQPGSVRQRVKSITIDTSVALVIAFFVNAAILILAGATMQGSPSVGVMEAPKLLAPTLGPLSPLLFGVALLIAGQNATVTATLGGQYAMEGFLGIKWSTMKRRLVTRGVAIVPAAFITGSGGIDAAEALLIGSQVVLALQLPFAVVPLLLATADKRVMGEYRPGLWILYVGAGIAALIIFSNVMLFITQF